MAIATLNGLISRLTTPSQQRLFLYKYGYGGCMTMAYFPLSGGDLFFARDYPSGQYPMPGKDGVQLSSALPGAPPVVAPTGGNKLYLSSVNIINADNNMPTFVLYDYMWMCDAYVMNSTSLQTPASPVALPARAADGEGCWLLARVISTGGTNTNDIRMTITYTNSQSVTGKQTFLRWRNTSSYYMLNQMMVPIPLAAGDTGIKAIESVQLSATTGTAGNLGFVIAKPLAFLPVAYGGQFSQPALGLAEVAGDACLGLGALAQQNSINYLVGEIVLVEG